MQDVPHWLRMLDIFVLPSLTEGRPTSIMEAMATGLPVVATQVGAVDTLVKHGITGLVVEPGDIAGLSDALEQMITDVKRRQAFGIEARRVAEREFDTEFMIAAYQQAYGSGYPDLPH